MTFRTFCCIVLSMLVSFDAWAGGTPQGTAFTYQGVFKVGGTPANGTHHLRFQLFDALTAGAQVGADFDAPALGIEDGLFKVDLDFGPGAFDGSARWLAVGVVTNGGATVTTLTPRQPVSAAPYALFALSANGPNLTNLNASNLASGTVPGAQLGGAYGNAVTFSHAGNSFTGGFTGDGAGLSSLNATNVASGNLATARMPTGGAWPLSSNLNLDSNTLVVDPANNRVGIGTITPGGPLHLRTSIPFLVLQDTASAANQTGYIDFRNDTFVETAWVGFGLVGSPDFSIVNARTNGDIILLPFSGNVGIGTSFPTIAKLHVVGNSGLGESNVAVYGFVSSAEQGSIGVRGESPNVSGRGVVGLGSAPDAYGVFSVGSFGASGSKAFRIDHPDDPENKYLLHYSAESPEVINFYSGKIVLDALGEAVVLLPSYFAKINKDPRYTLTAIGAAMPNLHVAQEIDAATLDVGARAGPSDIAPLCSFIIAGGVPGAKVSWRVEAVRNDQWMQQHGAPVEQEKAEYERGLYQHPELYGQPREMSMNHRPTAGTADSPGSGE